MAFGTSNRPRRCDAVGKGDADDTGVEVVAGIGDCSNGVALRGVILGSGVELGATDAASIGDRSPGVARRGVFFGSGVAVAAAEGACVADMVPDGDGVTATGVDEAGASEPREVVVVVAAVFTNFFEGAFEGGVASDFIFWRAFLATS